MEIDEFKQLIQEKMVECYRPMPWRDDTRGYYVLVSELMLQQTQVSRVIPKFMAFIERFPDERALARAPLADVIACWRGLGYNRRARFLHEAAKQIVDKGYFPATYDELIALPGVGKNTTGAILAYTHNAPSMFVETNVRTVYMHHFFQHADNVTDREIIETLEKTIDTDNPRQFYWAIMDYGTWLKSRGVRINHKSHQYKKQSPLEGSVRQVRGQIIDQLTKQSPISDVQLRHQLSADERYEPAIKGLVADKLVRHTAGLYTLST